MIPKQLHNEDFRFVLLEKKAKSPLPGIKWKEINYTYGSGKLREHIKNGGNYGVIGGHGDLRIIDVDDEEVGKKFEKLLSTFTVLTGNGGKHFYIFCEWDENFVFNIGEFRANNYYVVGPGSTHPNGNKYKVVNDSEIKKFNIDEIKTLLKDYLKKEKIDVSRSGNEFYIVKRLVREDKPFEEIDKHMRDHKYTKWTESSHQYRERTFKSALKNIEKEEKEALQFFVIVKGRPTAFLPKRMGDYIMERWYFKCVKGNDKQIYFYDEGYYKQNGISLIKAVSTSLLADLFKSYYVNEVENYIRNKSYVEPKSINNEWINLKNGLLNPITKEFKKHTPDIFSLHQLPIEYDPKADCPLFKSKLKEKCDDDWKFGLIQEMFGYCFLKDNRFEKAFLFYGDKRTMKSTTLSILAKMLGEESTTAMSLQHISDTKFAPAYLYGMLANICADLSPKELRNTAKFMEIVGQDKIHAGKKFEQEFSFLPFAKLIFSCNVVPVTTNKNPAFYRRWILIEFNIQTPEDEVDIRIREKFVEELPGILNWALAGLERILENSKLSFPLKDTDVKDLYERNSNSIQSFIYNEIDCENDESSVKKRVVYKKYKEYCKRYKLNIENQVKFGRVFKEVTGCGIQRIRTIPAYSGIAFKGDNSQHLEDFEGYRVENKMDNKVENKEKITI